MDVSSGSNRSDWRSLCLLPISYIAPIIQAPVLLEMVQNFTRSSSPMWNSVWFQYVYYIVIVSIVIILSSLHLEYLLICACLSPDFHSQCVFLCFALFWHYLSKKDFGTIFNKRLKCTYSIYHLWHLLVTNFVVKEQKCFNSKLAMLLAKQRARV